MFNTIVYIPMILAYTFITLLVVILGFIVIYVSHKIYASIYDNLPVAQLSSSSTIGLGLRHMAPSATILSELGSGVQEGRKSKTALRIIVTLEPCYLAFMVFTSTSSTAGRLAPITSTSAAASSSFFKCTSPHCRFIKFYDSMAQIPTRRHLAPLRGGLYM